MRCNPKHLSFLLSIFLSSMSYATGGDASLLGSKLTPVGAEVEANAEGTIPKWSGATVGAPAGVSYSGNGDLPPNPYAGEKPLFTITAANAEQHKAKLSDGMMALFKKYPETFKMDIYPSHRDFRYNSDYEARTKWNVGKAKMVNGIDGLQNMTGAVPFPMPTTGAEAMWNARISQPIPVADSTYDELAIYPDGKTQRYRTRLKIESPFAYDNHPVGKTSEEMGINSALVFYEVIEPKRKRGEMVIVNEPLDQVKHDRKAWVYIPGAKRVKRAPNAGYDTPVGPGGLLTADDNMGFNGAMNRYDWKLIGKQEMYIPYHSYGFDESGVDYAKLLVKGHPSSDYMRYELQRVWVVEATLKQGERHIYEKRRFYIAEDSWLIAAYDSYDGRGELWRVGLQNSIYDYFLKGYVARAQFNIDMQASAYVAIRLVNQTGPTNYTAKVEGPQYYTPGTLRKKGRR